MNSSAQNVDPAELAKFTALAQSWWDPNGPSKPLHDLNPLRLQYVERAVALPGKQILDVGCGGGILSESMARGGARVLGIDLAQAVLEVAELHALEAAGRGRLSGRCRRGPRARAARRVRRGHLHGDAGACAGSGGNAGRARRPGEAGRRCHRVDLESQSARIRSGDRRRGVHRARFAARNARVSEIHPSRRSSLVGDGRRNSISKT